MAAVWLTRRFLPFETALLAGIAAGITISFALSKIFAFRSRPWNRAVGEAAKFLIVYAAGCSIYRALAIFVKKIPCRARRATSSRRARGHSRRSGIDDGDKLHRSPIFYVSNISARKALPEHVMSATGLFLASLAATGRRCVVRSRGLWLRLCEPALSNSAYDKIYREIESTADPRRWFERAKPLAFSHRPTPPGSR